MFWALGAHLCAVCPVERGTCATKTQAALEGSEHVVCGSAQRRCVVRTASPSAAVPGCCTQLLLGRSTAWRPLVSSYPLSGQRFTYLKEVGMPSKLWLTLSFFIGLTNNSPADEVQGFLSQGKDCGQPRRGLGLWPPGALSQTPRFLGSILLSPELASCTKLLFGLLNPVIGPGS